MNILLDYYGKARSLELNGATVAVVPDIDKDDTLAEWRIFKQLYNCFKSSSAQDMTSTVVASESRCLIFPNVLQIYQIMPPTTATVEWSLSTLKLVKIYLRNCLLKDSMLDWCMQIAIEGSDSLSDEDITAIV